MLGKTWAVGVGGRGHEEGYSSLLHHSRCDDGSELQAHTSFSYFGRDLAASLSDPMALTDFGRGKAYLVHDSVRRVMTSTVRHPGLGRHSNGHSAWRRDPSGVPGSDDGRLSGCVRGGFAVVNDLLVAFSIQDSL